MLSAQPNARDRQVQRICQPLLHQTDAAGRGLRQILPRGVESREFLSCQSPVSEEAVSGLVAPRQSEAFELSGVRGGVVDWWFRSVSCS